MRPKLYDSYDYLAEQLKTKTYIQIAKENNTSTKTIQRRLNKFKLTNPSEKWTKEDIDLLKNEYYSNPEIYKLFPNRTVQSINHKASRLDIKKVRKAKYNMNQYFFQKWSNEMAYFFGWFCSDGCVSSKKNCCSFHIHAKDAYILKRFKKAMNSNHPITIRDQYAYFRVNNPIMHASLIRLGCTPRKSAILPFPDVPNNFLSHFLRGYLDGDGSICINKPNTIKVQFLGSKQFIDDLQMRLNKLLGLKFNKNSKHRRIWRCGYYGKDARKLCKWMYKECSDIYLKRKKEIFDNHLKAWNITYDAE